MRVVQKNERAIELIVTAREDLADDVVGLVLEDPRGTELPEWNPGAHVDVVLTEELVRQYSLCSSPADRRRWKIAVLLEPAGRGDRKSSTTRSTAAAESEFAVRATISRCGDRGATSSSPAESASHRSCR